MFLLQQTLSGRREIAVAVKCEGELDFPVFPYMNIGLEKEGGWMKWKSNALKVAGRRKDSHLEFVLN